MRITIHAVGRLKRGPEEELCRRYLERFSKIGPSIGLEFAGLQQIPESRAGDVATRRRDEASKLEPLLASGHSLILLDETGKDVDSQSLANRLSAMRDDGIRDCVFAIGGPDGHDQTLKQAASLVLSFGKLSWPHQIARIMLAEQLYRITTILSGHPYHRA